MSETHDALSECRQLLARMAEGELAPEDAARLDHLVRAHDEARRLYVLHTAMLAELEWAHGSIDLGAGVEIAADPPSSLETAFDAGAHRPAASDTAKVSAAQDSLARKIDWRRHPLYFLGAVAAVWLVWVASFGTTFAPWRDEPEVVTLPAVAPVDLMVARVDRAVDAVWPRTASPLAEGRHFKPGDQLVLSSGRVRLVFDSGAQTTVEGPARLVIEADDRIRLARGRLSCRLTEQSKGFSVETRWAKIIDLGTEFGVAISEAGRTDVRVFAGLVGVSPESPHAPHGEIRLAAGESLGIDAQGAFLGASTLTADAFPRQLPPCEPDLPQPAIPVTDKLVLWLAADGHVVRDAQGRVVNWPDLQIGGNRRAESARQQILAQRPQWVESAIAGRPAVRFDGQQTNLQTPPLGTTAEQTVVLVCTVSARPGQILNYNKSPNLVVETDRAITARVFPGVGDSVGVVESGPVEPGTRLIVVYQFSPEQGAARLRINGRDEGEAAAPKSAASFGAKWIGSHPTGRGHFRGDLAELAIFNRRLTDAEVHRLEAYLTKKYPE